jgi:hypothetical protein
MDNGIGSFNLNSLMVQDSIIIPDPGSASFIYITSSVVDTLSGRIYVNIGDYVTPGHCLVTALNGDSITSYATGIASDAIAVDYRTYPTGVNLIASETRSVNLFPNPVVDKLIISLNEKTTVKSIQVTDITGEIIIRQNPELNVEKTFTVSCNNLPFGVYYLIFDTSQGRVAKPFVKR